mgnify:CR=1 FL=1
MRIAGIIAEYDPFHKGHAAHIAATRAENGGNTTHVVAVISGNFTQRGEPALLSKFHRAEMALAAGADLVLELPLPWAMAPAETFARGGVAMLDALGCVDVLSFGSECGDIAILKQLATVSKHPSYQDTLRNALADGIPYAVASQAAASALLGDDAAARLSTPNNTLGIEYIRAATDLNANFDFFTLQRQGALHHETAPNQGFAAASLLRKWIREGDVEQDTNYMPEHTAPILFGSHAQGKTATSTHVLETALLARLRTMTPLDFASLPWLSEGLENRLYRSSRDAANYTDLLAELKTRRYPMARLRRVLWAALLGLSMRDCEGLPPYIRVLGMTKRGREILNAASPTLPILTRTSQLNALDDRCRRIFDLECTATDLHALCTIHPEPCGTDYTQKLIVK